ncbi:exodeoxyribonuclease V subunit alpha [Marinifilum caeruleilacunae]|uniref:RecBCD enzyme subunit RecD n=1 Tax=Marinifilum caeruleilacunae TaxID=2499076 RepID=A0ABX1WXJ8_9BACT|nr:exodeoxyribonuclease V subunit alpha [Marinifilum caeruleilacunae]NOU60590.1 exodeoxyribonuclease V subunit alpha [Marinifilum caeruleilacunae]
MPHTIDVHKEFASFFKDEMLETAAYLVSKKLEEGHTCINIEDFNSKLAQIERNEGSLKPIDIDALKRSHFVSEKAGEIQPFILHDGNFYLHRYYSYETEIIEKIEQMIACENDSDFNEELLLNHRDFILDLFSDHKVYKEFSKEENINWQLVGAITGMLSNFSIITGGPGTGKTTAVAKLLAILYNIKPDIKIALAAPTGKAAARMKESLMAAVIRGESGNRLIRELNDDMQSFTKLTASTLHRLLGYQPGTHYFKHDENNPLDYDVLIVDESSMIGASMMAKLLNAIKPTSKLIMLGDKDQLASVEAGSIFGDICLTQKDKMNKLSMERVELINSYITEADAGLDQDDLLQEAMNNKLQQHIIELKKSWRFKSTEGIGEFSHAVINGSLTDELITKPVSQEGQYVKVCNDYESTDLTDLMNGFKAYIKEEDIVQALMKLNQVRFLCAIRSGRYGVQHYNSLIGSYLENEGCLNPSSTFFENQPIMITKNNKEHNLFNGDIGLIRKDVSRDKLMAYFEDGDDESGYRAIPTTYLSEFTTVFAMTIHKSQGSEFEHVGIVLPDDENTPLLTRELIYTAITRAKQRAIIFSSNEVLKAGVVRQVERASGITNRFNKTQSK